MLHRALGESGIEVSALSVGSWRSFERIPRDTGAAVLIAARELGIDFLDDARYDDETGTAPLPTGYSEVVFGELFRAAGWARDKVVVANKLWWEFWPEQSAAEELDGSLERMGFDYLDLIYSAEPPEGVRVDEAVRSVVALIASGKARTWGVLNWPTEKIATAARLAAKERLPPPCAAQLPYSLAYPHFVEDGALAEALDSVGASVVASAVLAGGALTGKYTAGHSGGRLAGELDNPSRQAALRIGVILRARAAELGTSPPALAIVFALSNPRVASVLFGATSPEQVYENVAALQVLGRMGEAELADLRSFAG